MTQEDKQLLLKDLYPRLPYMPRVRITYQQQGVQGVDEDELSMDFNEQIVNDLRNGVILDIKLYLRPMSSMTEGEVDKIRLLLNNSHCGRTINDKNFRMEDFGVLWFTDMRTSECVGHTMMCIVIDWLNAHHFDYRGLIPMGLAIEVTEENNPYKE